MDSATQEEYSAKLKQRFWSLHQGDDTLNLAKCNNANEALPAFSFGEVENLASQFGVQCYQNSERRRKAEIFNDIWAVANIIAERAIAAKPKVVAGPAMATELAPIKVDDLHQNFDRRRIFNDILGDATVIAERAIAAQSQVVVDPEMDTALAPIKADPRAIFMPKRTVADFYAVTADYYNLSMQLSEYFGVVSPPRPEPQPVATAQSATRVFGFTAMVGAAPQALAPAENLEQEPKQEDDVQIVEEQPPSADGVSESAAEPDAAPAPAVEPPLQETPVSEALIESPIANEPMPTDRVVKVEPELVQPEVVETPAAAPVVEVSSESGQPKNKGSKKGKKK